MPLLKRGQQWVTVKAPSPLPVYGDSASYLFEPDGVRMLATIQPLSSVADRAIYGEKSTTMRLMLTTGDVELCEGMGVCVSHADGQCDHRIAAPPQRWGTHRRAVLQRL